MTFPPYPFSKNRYFPHKRMRSADFVRDQEFVDNKLSFLNHWVFGEGVALGLGVQRIGSDCLLVSPGFALDAHGRCLIVDEPAICHVRTLRGFDSLTGENAVLWLSYREELTEPMLVPGETNKQEYAVARERFSLSLTDRRPLPSDAVNSVLFSDTVLFEDNDLRVRQVIPRVLPDRRGVQVRLVIESFCPESVEIELYYAPILPGFKSVGSGQEAQLEKRLTIEKGETVLSLDVILTTAAQAVLISLPEDGFYLKRRGVRMGAQHKFQEEFSVVTGDPIQALRERLLAQSPQDLWRDGGEDGVPIALVRFVRYEESAILDDVVPLLRQQYVQTPYFQERLEQCGGFFPAPTNAGELPPHPTSDISPALRDHMTTGVVTLNTGLHLKEGKILCSDELSHNLGPGTVFVDFGVENVYPDANTDRNRTDLLLGDVSLFAQASGTYDDNFDRGVRVHPDKGTFRLAVRLKGALRQSSLRLRWFAWRFDEAAPDREPEGTLLRLEPDIIRVAPGGVVNFVPVFSNSSKASCDFWVPDHQAGIITRDGVYTAPEKDGLYQVCAQVRNRPESKVYAFVRVRTAAEEADHGTGSV